MTHSYKYYDVFAVFSVVALIVSNIIGQKLVPMGIFTTSAANLVFPVTYIISDVITEVYGYKRARRIVWISIASLLMMVLLFQLALIMPGIEAWTPEQQAAFELVLGNTPRFVLASLSAIWAGELMNAYVLSRMKIKTEGKNLWARLVGSTFVGQGVDSVVVYIIAFAGVLPWNVIVPAMLSGWFLKTIFEIIMLPVTYRIIAAVKKAEQIDVYDTHTNFTPFSLEIDTTDESKK